MDKHYAYPPAKIRNIYQIKNKTYGKYELKITNESNSIYPNSALNHLDGYPTYQY